MAEPTFDPAPGIYREARSVALSTMTAGGEIRYTTDGTAPGETSALYEKPIPVAGTTTIKAVAHRSGWSPSKVVTGDFTIADWQGPAPAWPSFSAPPVLPITDLKVATDGGGKAVIVWRQQDIAGAYFLYAAIYAGGKLASPTKISSGSANADYAQIAMDDRGNAIVVWSQPSATSPYRIHASRYFSDSGLWGDSRVISPEDSETDEKYPQIAMDNNGNAMVVWLREGAYLATPNNIYARRYSGSWEPIWQVTNYMLANESCFFPHVAMDKTGTAIAVWVELWPEYPYSIRASRFRSGEWGASREISTPDEWVEFPKVAMDGSGNAVAVWQRHYFFLDGRDYQSIHANTYSSASDDWGRHVEISSSSLGNNSYFPQVAMDNGGNAVAMWEQEMNESARSVAASRYVSGNWEPAVSGTDTGIFGLVMAGSGNGRYIAAWQQYGPDGERIRSSGYSTSSGWQAPVSISDGYAASAAYPIGIAVNDGGSAVAVWQECATSSSDSCNSIWTNRYQ